MASTKHITVVIDVDRTAADAALKGARRQLRRWHRQATRAMWAHRLRWLTPVPHAAITDPAR
jgi:hypothetical protein